MNWAQRRKLTYIALVLVFFGVIAFALIHKAVSVAPTCFDHKQNGDETGVDCGGGCNVYCSNQLPDPIVEWVRVFPVTPGIVDAVAYIEHDNVGASAQSVSYEFKLYDASNNVLADRKGTTFLGPAGESAIVETLIPIANGTVSTARFSFADPIGWQKVSPDFSQVVISTDQNSVASYTTGPSQVGTRLTATLQNSSRYNFTNLDVVAIFYDKDGNAITASKELLPSLPALQNTTMYFTWPYAVNNIARVQIIPRFNPFTAQSL
jgi:hypothetical protein